VEINLFLQMLKSYLVIICRYLLVTPKERKVVILESLFTPTKWRMTLARVLYMHYEVLNVLWIPTHLTAAVGIGADTALVMDIGKDEAHVIPLVNGVTILNHVISHDVGAAAFDM